MLSDQAEANSMPGLEIQADDVRCTHGATSGEISEDEIFYMQARGIRKADGRASSSTVSFSPCSKGWNPSLFANTLAGWSVKNSAFRPLEDSGDVVARFLRCLTPCEGVILAVAGGIVLSRASTIGVLCAGAWKRCLHQHFDDHV